MAGNSTTRSVSAFVDLTDPTISGSGVAGGSLGKRVVVRVPNLDLHLW